jgi:hypothetical protein
MGRRLLYLLIQRNLLAGLDWRVGLPSAHSYSSITDYLRDFGIKYTSCFATEDIAGCETSQAMLIPDTYNAIILSNRGDNSWQTSPFGAGLSHYVGFHGDGFYKPSASKVFSNPRRGGNNRDPQSETRPTRVRGGHLPSLIDRYIQYLSPGGSIFINNEVVYTRPRVIIYVPCDALVTHGGSLSPIELYSIDWEIVGCKDVATTSQPPSESAKVIRVCSKDVKHNCVDPIELAIRLNRFASVIE